MVVIPNIRRKYMVGRIPKGETVPMSSCVVTLATDSATYTGSARTVGVTVTWEGATLAVNTDYTLAYSNNVNLGPATVTVTGMGQFAGSVTKTFYIVEASESPWSFDLTKTSYVGAKTISASGFSYILPIVQDYDQTGAIVPVARFVSNSFLLGYSLPKDSDGEYHVTNLVTSNTAFSEGGVDSNDYVHPFYFDKNRSFWVSNSGSKVLKAKDGTTSPDFSGYLDGNFSHVSRPMIVNGGRRLLVPGEEWKVYSFDFGTRYDISTIDLSSKSETTFLDKNTRYKVRAVLFGAGGSQALVSAIYYQGGSSPVYHVSCPTPYSLDGATEITSQSFSSTASAIEAINVLNNGQTLMLSSSNGIMEYNLVA